MKNESGAAAVRLILGLVVITVGILFFLGNLGIINPHEILRLWPAIFIIIGLVHILQPHQRGRFVLGSVLIIIGAVMLLKRLYIIPLGLGELWPLILIFFGIMMILNHSVFQKKTAEYPDRSPNRGENDRSFLSKSAILGGSNCYCVSKDFKGGDLTAIMGGFEIDLRDASINTEATETKEAVLDIFVVMGGIEMHIPDDWTVILQVTPILGGVDDKTVARKDGGKQLIIRGTVIMGGVDIKN